MRVLKRNRYGCSQCSLFRIFSTSHLGAVPIDRCFILTGQYCKVIVGIHPFGIHPFVQRTSMSQGFWPYILYIYVSIYTDCMAYDKSLYIYIYTHFCYKLQSRFIGSCARFQWKTEINRDPHSSMVLTGIQGGGTSCDMYRLVVQGYIPNSQDTPYFYVSLGYTSIKKTWCNSHFRKGLWMVDIDIPSSTWSMPGP